MAWFFRRTVGSFTGRYEHLHQLRAVGCRGTIKSNVSIYPLNALLAASVEREGSSALVMPVFHAWLASGGVGEMHWSLCCCWWWYSVKNENPLSGWIILAQWHKSLHHIEKKNVFGKRILNEDTNFQNWSLILVQGLIGATFGLVWVWCASKKCIQKTFYSDTDYSAHLWLIQQPK